MSDTEAAEKTEAKTGNKKRENYFEKHFERLKEKLECIKKEIQRIKDEQPDGKFTPNIYNSLEPYCNTDTVTSVMNTASNTRDASVSRVTSIGVCEPWESLRIDHTVLPKGESHPIAQPADKQNLRKGQKQGTSHYPNIRNVNFDMKKYANRHLDYGDVPMLRKELKETYTAESSAKVEDDYNRTMQDYTRMELDVCLDVLRPPNRDIVRDAMIAYLQNTPGSRKALFKCLCDSDKKQKEKEEKEKKEGNEEAAEEKENEKEKKQKKAKGKAKKKEPEPEPEPETETEAEYTEVTETADETE